MPHREFTDRAERTTGSASGEEEPGVFTVRESCTDRPETVRLPKCQAKHPGIWVLSTEGQ